MVQRNGSVEKKVVQIPIHPKCLPAVSPLGGGGGDLRHFWHQKRFKHLNLPQQPPRFAETSLYIGKLVSHFSYGTVLPEACYQPITGECTGQALNFNIKIRKTGQV